VASLSQGRTAAAQCGLFTHKSVPVIFEPPCITTIVKIYIINFRLVSKKQYSQIRIGLRKLPVRSGIPP